MRVTFPCADLELEGDLTTPAGCSRGAVICHPHPQYGGDMDNPIVTAVTTALQQAGCASTSAVSAPAAVRMAAG